MMHDYNMPNVSAVIAFISWNGFPRTIRSLLIAKLRDNYSNQREQLSSFDHENGDRPKIWMRIPYLGKRGETLLKKCIKKIRSNLTRSVNFMVICENKKIAYFRIKTMQIQILVSIRFRFSQAEFMGEEWLYSDWLIVASSREAHYYCI